MKYIIIPGLRYGRPLSTATRNAVIWCRALYCVATTYQKKNNIILYIYTMYTRTIVLRLR